MSETEGQEGRRRLRGGGYEEIGKMRRGFEKAGRKTDREGKGTGQDGKWGRRHGEKVSKEN